MSLGEIVVYLLTLAGIGTAALLDVVHQLKDELKHKQDGDKKTDKK